MCVSQLPQALLMSNFLPQELDGSNKCLSGCFQLNRDSVGLGCPFLLTVRPEGGPDAGWLPGHGAGWIPVDWTCVGCLVVLLLTTGISSPLSGVAGRGCVDGGGFLPIHGLISLSENRLLLCDLSFGRHKFHHEIRPTWTKDEQHCPPLRPEESSAAGLSPQLSDAQP